MYKISYLPTARQDIFSIITYISEFLKADKAALDLLDEFDHAIALLKDFPYAHPVYRAVKSLEAEYRLLPVKNYAVFYVVQEREKQVEIRRILYAKMDLDKIINREATES